MRGVLLDIAGMPALQRRAELRRTERIVSNEDGREELVFITDPFDACRLFLAVILALTQLLHIAAHEHVLQTCIALFELTSLLLLRDELTPLKLQGVDVLRQFALHIMRLQGQMYHIGVRQLIYEI